LTLRRHLEQARARVVALGRGEVSAAAGDGRVLEGPGSEARLDRLHARFEKLNAKQKVGRKPVDRTRLGIAAWLTAWATCVGISAAILFSYSGAGSLNERLTHLAVYPNCDAARLLGQAPAVKGEPGYWPQHDADSDGIACEPIPAWKMAG
jgi:hypothetical protein